MESMTGRIVCPRCGEEIEVSEALRHQIEEEAVGLEKEKHAQDIEKIKKLVSEQAEKRLREEMEFKQKEHREEIAEAEKRNRELQEQILEMTRTLRQIRKEAEESRLKLEQKLAAEEEKIRQEAKKQAEEEQHLKNLEREKQLQDALKTNEELRRKLEQGSQQTQGEVLELELERELRETFPNDEIKPIAKGVRGGDIIQKVIDRNGRSCGTVLWELKNAKWQANWIAKLREDQRNLKAEVAVLVSAAPVEDVPVFVYREGVWISGRAASLALAYALRYNLIQIFNLKTAAVGKNEKMEVIYNYLSGIEFRQRVEAIVESFSEMQAEIEREKRWFSSKWARQEKSLRRVIDHTHGMYGDLQGIMGTSLPELKAGNINSIISKEDAEDN